MITRSSRRASQGSALIELTLLLPVLLLLAVGVGDFARVFYYGIVTENAARAGAQYALRNNYTNVTGIDNAAVQDASVSDFTSANVTQAACFLRCPGSAAEMACTEPNLTSCGAQSAYLYVRVRTQYTFNTLLNYPGIPASTALHGLAIVRVR